MTNDQKYRIFLMSKIIISHQIAHNLNIYVQYINSAVIINTIVLFQAPYWHNRNNKYLCNFLIQQQVF